MQTSPDTAARGLLLLLLCACPPEGDANPTGSSTGDTSTGSQTSSSSGGDASTSGTSTTDAPETSDTSSGTSGDSTGSSSTTSDDSSSGDSSSGDSSSGDSSSGDSSSGGDPECVQNFGFDETDFCYSKQPVQYGEVPGTRLLLAGDVQPDGHLDVIVPGAAGGIAVYPGDGAGGLGPPVLTPTDPPTSAAAGDFDGDGQLDLVVSFAGVTPRIDLMLGDGGGGFVLEDSFPSGVSVARSLATGDFDNDGDLDAVAIHNGVGVNHPKRLGSVTSAGGVAWSYADQPLINIFKDDFTYDAWLPYLTIGSVDGVYTDVIVTTERSVDQPHRLRSDGLGKFTYQGLLDPKGSLIGVFPLVVLDVDEDGDNDLIGPTKPGLLVFKYLENLGGGTWTPPVLSDLSEGAQAGMAVGELIQGPRPDLVYSGGDGWPTMARRIEADGEVVSPGGLGFNLGPSRAFVLPDLNEDGMSDFVFVPQSAPYPLSVKLSQ